MSGLSKIAALREAAARMNAEHEQDYDACDPLDPNARPQPPPRAKPREHEQAASAMAAAPVATAPAAPKTPSTPTSAPKVGKASASADRIHTSIYLTRDIRRRLREIAAAEECKVHDLIMEGVNEVVARRSARRNAPP